jgi:hypothetical protein
MQVPRRPWSTDGEKILDSQRREVQVFSTGATATRNPTTTTRAQLLEHIVKVVNSTGDKS